MPCSECARLQVTIDRLALELADEAADHARTCEQLLEARRQIRTWRRVAQWIFEARQQEDR